MTFKEFLQEGATSDVLNGRPKFTQEERDQIAQSIDGQDHGIFKGEKDGNTVFVKGGTVHPNLAAAIKGYHEGMKSGIADVQKRVAGRKK